MSSSQENNKTKETKDPLIGEVVYAIGSGKHKDDIWDDRELIAYWDKAKEAYKKRHTQLSKKEDSAPFSMDYRHQKKRAEKQQGSSGISHSGKKKKTVDHRRPMKSEPPSVSFESPSQAAANYYSQEQCYHGDDSLTQLITSWYYCGYYSGYLAGSNRGNDDEH